MIRRSPDSACRRNKAAGPPLKWGIVGPGSLPSSCVAAPAELAMCTTRDCARAYSEGTCSLNQLRSHSAEVGLQACPSFTGLYMFPMLDGAKKLALMYHLLFNPCLHRWTAPVQYTVQYAVQYSLQKCLYGRTSGRRSLVTPANRSLATLDYVLVVGTLSVPPPCAPDPPGCARVPLSPTASSDRHTMRKSWS